MSMYFDPTDNLLGAGLLVWVAVGAVWVGVIWFFNGPPEPLTREGRAARRARRERNRR